MQTIDEKLLLNEEVFSNGWWLSLLCKASAAADRELACWNSGPLMSIRG